MPNYKTPDFEATPYRVHSKASKVEKLSNMSLIKVVDFFLIFDKKFVWKEYFFHGYGFLSLEGTQLAEPSTSPALPS